MLIIASSTRKGVVELIGRRQKLAQEHDAPRFYALTSQMAIILDGNIGLTFSKTSHSNAVRRLIENVELTLILINFK